MANEPIEKYLYGIDPDCIGNAEFLKYPGLRVKNTCYPIHIHLTSWVSYRMSLASDERWHGDMPLRYIGKDAEGRHYSAYPIERLREIAREAREADIDIVPYKSVG